MTEVLELRSGRSGRALAIAPAVLLAPMEGITDPVFRTLVTSLGGVGAACTEFLRISVHPLPARLVRRALGPARSCPTAVQFMAGEERHVAESVRAAEDAGADWIDLNFGCPAPVVFNKCAGSALLADPQAMARIVAAAVSATTLPVSAKMRAGISDRERMRDCLRAVADAGADLVTMHARLRAQSYSVGATWSWIAEARAMLAASGHRIPLVGNGSVEAAADIARMREETGCDAVMVGRAALADPWIFREAAGGGAPSAAEAAAFAVRYGEAVAQARGQPIALAKLKQLARYYRCGGLLADPADRQRLLREPTFAAIRGYFAARAGLAAEAQAACGSGVR